VNPPSQSTAKHWQWLSVFLMSLVARKYLVVNALVGIRAIATSDSEDTGSLVTDAKLKAIFGPA